MPVNREHSNYEPRGVVGILKSFDEVPVKKKGVGKKQRKRPAKQKKQIQIAA